MREKEKFLRGEIEPTIEVDFIRFLGILICKFPVGKDKDSWGQRIVALKFNEAKSLNDL